MALEATSKGSANSKLRRVLANNRTFRRAGIEVGDSVCFREQVGRKSAPESRGHAVIPDFDEPDLTSKLPRQTFKVARYCESRLRASTEVGGARDLGAALPQRSVSEDGVMDSPECESLLPDDSDNPAPTVGKESPGGASPSTSPRSTAPDYGDKTVAL